MTEEETEELSEAFERWSDAMYEKENELNSMEDMLVADVVNDVLKDNVVFFDVYYGDRCECNISADKAARDYGNLYVDYAVWKNDNHNRLEIFINELGLCE